MLAAIEDKMHVFLWEETENILPVIAQAKLLNFSLYFSWNNPFRPLIWINIEQLEGHLFTLCFLYT